MAIFGRLFLLLVVLLCTVHAQANSLKVGIGISKPPYVIQDKNSGVEYEIVERALNLAGYDMVPHYMPLLRIPPSLNSTQIDGGMHLREHLDIKAFFTAPVIEYRNFAITLKNSLFKPQSLSDLSKGRVLAFQNASRLLGAAYGEAVSKNPSYEEVANQVLQVKMLLAGRVDIAVADYRIFLHFAKVAIEDFGAEAEFTFYPLFPPTPYRAAFRSREVRDRFDQALIVLRETGEYDQIIRRYISDEDLKNVPFDRSN